MLRKKEFPYESLEAFGSETIAATGEKASDPLTMLSAAEDLTAVRACIEAVGGDDGELLVHLDAITGRRWKEAAAALGLPESTLRSRWRRLLDRLRDCVEGKTGKPVAPTRPGGD